MLIIYNLSPIIESLSLSICISVVKNDLQQLRLFCLTLTLSPRPPKGTLGLFLVPMLRTRILPTFLVKTKDCQLLKIVWQWKIEIKGYNGIE